jgi:hypothetical protein
VSAKKWEGLIKLYDEYNGIVDNYNANATSVPSTYQTNTPIQKINNDYLNINNFAHALLHLAIYKIYNDTLLQFGDLPVDNTDKPDMETQMRDKSVPEIYLPTKLFSAIFKTNTMFVIFDDNYNKNNQSFAHTSVSSDDYVILLKTGPHFQTLTLQVGSSDDKRKNLFDAACQIFNINNCYP